MRNVRIKLIKSEEVVNQGSKTLAEAYQVPRWVAKRAMNMINSDENPEEVGIYDATENMVIFFYSVDMTGLTEKDFQICLHQQWMAFEDALIGNREFKVS